MSGQTDGLQTRQIGRAEVLSRDPQIQGGKACFTGTRIPLGAVKSFARHGCTAEEIQKEYPTLSLEQIRWGMMLVATPTGED